MLRQLGKLAGFGQLEQSLPNPDALGIHFLRDWQTSISLRECIFFVPEGLKYRYTSVEDNALMSSIKYRSCRM